MRGLVGPPDFNDRATLKATDGGVFENVPPLKNSPAVALDQPIQKPIMTSDFFAHAAAVEAPNRPVMTNEILGQLLAQLARFEQQMQGVRDRIHYEPFIAIVPGNTSAPVQVNPGRVVVLTVHAPSTNGAASVITLTEDAGASAQVLFSESLAAGATLVNLHLPFRQLWGFSSTNNVVVAGYVRW